MSSPPTDPDADLRGAVAPPLTGEEDRAVLLASAMGLDPGDTPFPWQLRLLDGAVDGRLPRSLDVPTGLGKTATMAIWLVARALGAALPRRLVYIVDRRVVVDQATTVAIGLRRWVDDQPAIRERLGLVDGPLPVSTLRGKHVDNREWLDDPAAPAIIVGTVDMIGSRLLFQGYRASRKIRPYLAGLLGSDTLFVLDEAHLVPPFEQLLNQAVRDRRELGGLASEPALARLPPARLLTLSATGRPGRGESFPFRDDEAGHPVVDQRLSAPKTLSFERVDKADELPKAVAERAWQLVTDLGRPARCILFLSQRAHAEAARAHLRSLSGLDKLKRGETAAADVELLVGGRRVYEREEAARSLRSLGFIAGSDAVASRPAFLIATSAGEVGVDLDADHMVSDLVPWERMVQRLGRVNRRGRGDAQVVVLDAPAESKTPEEVVARKMAVRRLLTELPIQPDGGRDVSLGALLRVQRASRTHDEELAALVREASSPEPPFPRLERPILDDWAMTSLKPHAGRPAVAPWLRGWVDDRPQVAIVWRRDLPVPEAGRPRETMMKRFFEAAPPHASEVLEIDSGFAADWLNKRVRKLVRKADKREETARRTKEGKEDKKEDRTKGELRRGSVVAMTRGTRSEKMECWTLEQLDKKSKREVERLLARAELFLDVRIAGLSGGLLDPSADDPPRTADGDGETRFEDVHVPFRVRMSDKDGVEDPEIDGDVQWRERARFPVKTTAGGEVVGWLVVLKADSDAATEEDRSAGPPQCLQEHQRWTAEEAEALAQRLGLSAEARRVLVVAARLHDEGKRAARWQRAFHAPPAPTDDPGRVYAKTKGPVNVSLLDGYRHELGSLAYAERDPELEALPERHRELVLHLIASHHGFARPSISTSGCDDAPPSALEARAREVARRYLSLQREWGPWGLAWWEALLRAADQRASRRNDRRDARSQTCCKGGQ